MAYVWIPSLLRDLTGGVSEMHVPGQTVDDLVSVLENQFPGLRSRLCEGSAIRPNIAVIIDGLRSKKDLRESVSDTSEVHFVPAISGGCSNRVPSNA